MTILPTIERELRVQARQPATHVLRLLGALALLVESFLFVMTHGFGQDQGSRVFCLLNGTLFIFIWLLAPMVSADCISRERREGTVGLLFLTPLKAHDIIMAKGITHGLRALTIWLAALPVLTIPFLVGGVTWKEAVWSAMVNFSSICMALAAGLLASSISKRWLRAQVLAVILAGIFGGLFVYVSGCGLWILEMCFSSGAWRPFPSTDEIALGGFYVTSGLWDIDWNQMFDAFYKGGLGNRWLLLGAAMMILSAAFLRLVIAMSALLLERVWHEEAPSARQQKFWKVLATPIVGESFLRRWLHRKLEANPVGWLETRTWSGRSIMWGWLAAMVTFYCWALSGNNSLAIFHRIQNLMELVLLAGMAATAAASFQRERETGVMELLLVSPMTERQIIGGRVRALWGQFLPAVMLLLAVWLYFKALPSVDYYYRAAEFDLMPFMFASYLCLPFVGLYNSLRHRNFISSFLLTFLTVMVLPLLFWYIMEQLRRSMIVPPRMNPNALIIGARMLIPGRSPPQIVTLLASPAFIALIQFIVGASIGRRLYADLKHRNFAFSRALA